MVEDLFCFAHLSFFCRKFLICDPAEVKRFQETSKIQTTVKAMIVPVKTVG
jgi:hypothetical protein